MPRNCGCGGQTCDCLIVSGVGAAVTGSGNADDPYVISISGANFATVDHLGGDIDLGDLDITTDMTIRVELNDDATVLMPATPAPPAGIRLELMFTHIVPSTITMDPVILWPGGIAPTLVGPTGDWVSLIFDGAQWVGVAMPNMA